jgi:hypothetical protein
VRVVVTEDNPVQLMVFLVLAGQILAVVVAVAGAQAD